MSKRILSLHNTIYAQCEYLCRKHYHVEFMYLPDNYLRHSIIKTAKAAIRFYFTCEPA